MVSDRRMAPSCTRYRSRVVALIFNNKKGWSPLHQSGLDPAAGLIELFRASVPRVVSVGISNAASAASL